MNHSQVHNSIGSVAKAALPTEQPLAISLTGMFHFMVLLECKLMPASKALASAG